MTRSKLGLLALTGILTAMFAAGWYPVGLLIFFASITVPILKILSLMGILISVQRRSHWRPRDRAVLYRVVEIIGRWSMLDMFVVSVMVESHAMLWKTGHVQVVKKSQSESAQSISPSPSASSTC